MQLDLAVVLRCDNTTCHVENLGDNARLDAVYSTPMMEHDIRVAPGQLVAVDRAAAPPQVVYRWAHIYAKETSEGYDLRRDNGQPVDPAQLRADEYPQIEAMYARLDALQALDAKQLVQDGYDQIAERYLEWAQQDPDGMREKYVHWMLEELPAGAAVLELGCGAGMPAAHMLAQRFQVTGVDLSARQIELARQYVPEAHFLQADMTTLDLPPESYDGVLSLYAVFHVPREQQPQLFRDIAGWLRPGGLLIATMSTGASASSVEENFMGAPMYWSTYDAETNVRMVQEAGLEIVRAEIETVVEFGETVRFLWIVARKPEGEP